MSVREDLASDLLAEMENLLDERKQSECVRLEISDRTTSAMMAFLRSTLDIQDTSIYATPGPLDLTSFTRLADLEGFPDHKYSNWPPQRPPGIDATDSMFDVIRERDVLLHHPYESFEPVIRFISEAADDPDVVAIKQILYRTSRNSPIIDALIRASERGKNVTVIVELKARFDEARNIERARQMEQAGVQVVYGVRGLKTHAKICVVVRREPQGFQRYVHFGTGNYNESTARLYTDVSVMTCDDELGADAISFFNSITGYSEPQKFLRLEMAPLGIRDKLLEMIHVETQHCRSGHEARIVGRLNSLADPLIIEALYEASKAGVRIQLNVRGICCLRPGVPDMSDNITVTSIVDRFLEHSRIVYFLHAGDRRVFISSADWMPRNLDRRVELLVPVEDEVCKSQLIDILETAFDDTAKARILQSDGSYHRAIADDGMPANRSQEMLYIQAVEATASERPRQRQRFVPHQSPDA